MNKEKFLKSISEYFWRLTGDDGSLVCPKHRIEHTGKNVYSAAIDLKIYELTGEEKYYQRSKVRVQQTLTRLIKDPEFGYWIFYPGRLNKWNVSNSIIDAGACLDVLAVFYQGSHEKLDKEEKKEIEQAILKNGDTYLKEAIVSKPITNQRLWGATGLASAYKIFKKTDWRQSLIESVNKSFAEMWSDGTFPYHPGWREAKIFEGINDTTTFYHSRCLGFIYYILDCIDQNPVEYKDRLIKAANLLVAMYQPDGIKNINLECKRWYWDSHYEVASASFDIYALVKTYQLTNDNVYIYYAQKAFEQVMNHLLPDGGITSHVGEPQNNFQCRVFWNSNLVWLARSIRELFLAQSQIRESEAEFVYLNDSGILKFKNKSYSCIIRGKKNAMSLMWGPAIGGGSMLYFGRGQEDWKNIFIFNDWQEDIAGNFSFYCGKNYFLNLKNIVIANKRDIKEDLHHVLGRLRRPDFQGFLTSLLKLFRWIFLSGRLVYTSQWATNVDQIIQDNQAKFESVAATKGGQGLVGVRIEREYTFKEDRLDIRESVIIKNQSIKRIKYNKILGVTDFKIDTNLKYRQNDRNIVCYNNQVESRLVVSYSLK